MADSFSKKENKKKKAKKQQDKLLRREERKTHNNKGKTLDEMIVYLDENGNFTDTPPHLQVRSSSTSGKKSAAGTPDKEGDGLYTGTVTFLSEKGFGFITEDQTKENIFFHQLQQQEIIKKNDNVSYKKEDGPKGQKAVEIRIKK